MSTFKLVIRPYILLVLCYSYSKQSILGVCNILSSSFSWLNMTSTLPPSSFSTRTTVHAYAHINLWGLIHVWARAHIISHIYTHAHTRMLRWNKNVIFFPRGKKLFERSCSLALSVSSGHHPLSIPTKKTTFLSPHKKGYFKRSELWLALNKRLWKNQGLKKNQLLCLQVDHFV